MGGKFQETHKFSENAREADKEFRGLANGGEDLGPGPFANVVRNGECTMRPIAEGVDVTRRDLLPVKMLQLLKQLYILK